jgi:glycosyltransferase involved in cell wall biosynthesis
MQPPVTVIIPAYNRSQMLAEALASVRAQTFRDFQVVVVDDGSEEDLRSVVEPFGPAVRHLRTERGGAARARNAGVAAARTDLVAFLDSDDLWLPEHLARTVDVLRRRPEVVLVYHDTLSVDHAGRPAPPRKRRPRPSGSVTEALFAYDVVPTPSVVCRRQTLLQAGGFDPAVVPSEDYDLWLRMSLLGAFACVDEPLMLRRRHAGNISRQHRVRNEIVRAVLKERFWRQPAARRAIRESRAYAVLAKAFYRSGRALLRGGWNTSARRFLRRSLQYRPTYLRAVFWLAVAFCARRADAPDDPAVEVLRTTRYRWE